MNSRRTILLVAELQEGNNMDYDYTKTQIEFRSDQLAGRAMSIHYRNNGWVEYFNKTGQVWVVDTPTLKLHQTWRQQAIDHIASHYSSESDVIGLVQHLARIRMDQPFIMPMFIRINENNAPVITAGNCRLDAFILNNTDAKDISAVVYTTREEAPEGFGNVRKIQTTDEFDSIYDLKDIDYRLAINLLSETEYYVISSIVRHTIFDRTTIEKAHVEATTSCLGFWSRFANKKTNKIDIEIRCTEATSKLVKESPLFNVSFVYEPANEWTWSYGKILGSYRQTDDPIDKGKLSLWLFDVVEPVNLELLIPWADNKFSSFYSKNQKSVLFETSHITSMQVIGDWIK